MKMATKKQVETCRTLFRKTKLYYRTLKDNSKLRNAVLKRTQYDLDDLEEYEAHEIITKLSIEADKQRKGWFPPEAAAKETEKK